MANNNNEGADNDPDNSKDSGLEKSFVGKFMSGLMNSTPLTKWFRKESPSKSTIRRREEDEDEDYDVSYSFQPPSKRAKLPTDVERNNFSAHVFESPVTVHTSKNVNNVSSKVCGKFPEPMPGPSGIKSRNLFERHNTGSANTISNDSFGDQLEIVNGENDSDSEESTSGYLSASKLLSKQQCEDILVHRETREKVTPKTRSLFTPTTDSSGKRTLFPERSPQLNTSLSSRRPAFNASTFGSPNFVDTTLSTRRILDSPFYSGRTIYGGASAYGQRLGRKSFEDLTAITRSSVQIKPVNEHKNKSTGESTTLSKTARRILSTLEQYSTPISDAKKIPVTPRKQGLLTSYVGATPYLVRDRRRPANTELQIPTVPELLQMKQKERLQNSTEAVRQIATKSQSSLNKEEYKLRTEEDNKQKHSNKMKTSVASARQKMQPIERVSEVKLPKISLPITTLPKFDFVLMPPSSSSDTNKDKQETNKSTNITKLAVSTIFKPTVVVEKKETEFKAVEKAKTSEYTFSEPLVVSKDLKSVAAINCFKFSDPVYKKSPDSSLMFKSTDNNVNSGFKLKNNGENVNFSVITKPAPQLSTGSVMDILKKKKDASPSQNKITTIQARWECPTCLVRNDPNKTKCCACDEPKPEEQEKKGFGNQFKLSSDKWECNSCMVRNNNSDTKCVACETAKPSDSKQTGAVISGFGDKFKPAASTWECSSCLIRNKNEANKCAACGVAKPGKSTGAGTFGDKFKPSNDTWECGTCMIRNKKDVDKCVACETPKPGGGNTSATPKSVTFSNSTTGVAFSFGIKQEWECKTCLIKNKNDLKKCAACEMPRENLNATNPGFGDAFKTKGGEWECSSCMVKNKSTIDTCVCCGVNKPGSSGKLEVGKNEEKKPISSFNFGIDKSGAQFKFGIPSSSTETKENTAVSSTPTALSFGETAKSSTAPSSTYTFGISTQKKIVATEPLTSTTSVSTALSTNPLLKPSEKLPEKVTPAAAGFKFGLDNSLNNQVSEATVSSSQTTTTAAPLSTGFGSATIPAFQFKPSAINGEINKPRDGAFGNDPNKTNMFSNDLNKSKEALFATDASKPKEAHFNKMTKAVESPFGSTNKPLDSPFGVSSKVVDSPFGTPSKPTESPFGSASKPVELPFGSTTKPTDIPFGSASKATESPFGTASKSTDSTFGGASKPTDSPFGGPNSGKPADSPFGNTNKPADSPFGGGMSKPANSPFGNVSKPTESPFGGGMVKPADSPFRTPSKSVKSPFWKESKPVDFGGTKPTESPFGAMNKPAESPFANSTDLSKPKDSLFGGPNDTINKSQSGLFSNVNDGSKHPEAIFGGDTNKPKDIVFGSKPPEGTNLFAPPSSTPAFSFTPKPAEPAPPSFSSAPASQPIFKFGPEAAQNPLKRPGGDASDNVSNGFGSGAKLPAFGTPQAFGSAENKPFSFGSTEAPKSSGFSFGQAEKPSAAAGPVFSFVGGPPNTSSGGFNFAAPNAGFNFGAPPAKVESQQFSAPPSSNVFGSSGTAAKNGSFNFGTNANNNNQKAVFSFGANQASQPNQPGFPAQAQSGFNFGTPAPLNAPPAFNFTGAPPSFNFTDGNTTQTQPPRKIKKALRRTHR